jgi:hypothetical protein
MLPEFLINFLSKYQEQTLESHINISGENFIKNYLLIIFVIGLIQEVFVAVVKGIFNFDISNKIKKGRRIASIFLLSVSLALEIIAYFIFREPMILFFMFGSLGLMIISYVWYRLMSILTNKIKSSSVTQAPTNY